MKGLKSIVKVTNKYSTQIGIFLNVLILFISFPLFSQQQGNALRYNASNGYCDATLPTVFDNIPSNNFTVECWVKVESNSVSKRIMFAQKDINNFCTILINTSNVPYFYVVDNGTSYSVNTQTTLSTVQWTHLAFVWNASSNTITSFINGNQVNTISGGTSSTGANNIMTIGARTDGQQLFKGSIDELRIWNDIRTPCEIFASKNSTFTSPQSNLVASYNFNHGVAGGANPGETLLSELNGVYNATLHDFNLTGGNSNWVSSEATITHTNHNSSTLFSNDVITACESYLWSDGVTYNSSNNTATYNYTDPTTGCNCTDFLDLSIDTPITVDVLPSNSFCAEYELPSLTVGSYFTSPNGSGLTLNSGELITSSQTVYIYAENGTCSDESTFDITIDTTVTVDLVDDTASCVQFELPDLTLGNYFSESNGSGTSFSANDILTNSQTMFIYAENGTCSDESSFEITISDNPINTVSLNEKTLSADQSNASYQWLDCDNGNSPIPGETNQVFTPINNGNYAVQITNGTCSLVSDCQSVNTIGLSTLSETHVVEVYPNPTTGEITIYLSKAEPSIVEVYNSLGSLINQMSISNIENKLVIQGESGLYLLKVKNESTTETVRVIKQ